MRIMHVCIFIIILTSILGCGKDSNTAVVNPVVGSWTFNNLSLQETLVFNADGTYSDTESGTNAHVPATIAGAYSTPTATTLIIDPGSATAITNTVAFPDSIHMILTPQGSGTAQTYTRQ